MAILRTQLMTVFAWGCNSSKRLPDGKGIRFKVEGFKYTGAVEVIYNTGTDLLDVVLSGNNTKVEDVYLDNLIDVIDNLVEKTSNYEQRVQQEYAL